MCKIREIDSDELELVVDPDEALRVRVALLDVAGVPLHASCEFSGFLLDADRVFGFSGIGPFLDREVVQLI